MQKDSVLGTFTVAVILCLVCSVLVAGSAVYFKPRQEANKEHDVKKNLLLAAGLINDPNASSGEVREAFQGLEKKVINLQTGEVITNPPKDFDPRKAVKDSGQSVKIPKSEDVAGIKVRAKLAEIYEVQRDGRLEMVILPVYGKGLWSTLYGFLVLSSDLKKIIGLSFYEHAETPGLGGEIDNPSWKALWPGKIPFDEKMNPKIQVIKGSISVGDPEKDHKVDGLSGATITSVGVTNLLQYWLGGQGYGPFLKRLAMERGKSVED